MTGDAWLVDLDGTLYRPWPMKWMMGLQLLLTSPRTRECVLTFRREHEPLRLDAPETIGSPYRLQLERAAGRLGIDVRELEPLISEWMIRRPCRWIAAFARTSLLEEIRDFRAEGGRTAVVSDYPARAKLSALGAENDFDVVVANGEPGGPERLKPDPDGYLRASKELEVPPERCLVIGDRIDADGEAAKRAGMRFRRVR